TRGKGSAPDSGERPAPPEDLLPILRQQCDNAARRHFQGKGQRNDPADRGAGNQVEAGRDRRIDFVLEIGKQLCRVQSTETAAREGEDLKPGWRGLVQEFPSRQPRHKSVGREMSCASILGDAGIFYSRYPPLTTCTSNRSDRKLNGV